MLATCKVGCASDTYMHQRGTLVIFDVTDVGRLLHPDVLTEALQTLKK